MDLTIATRGKVHGRLRKTADSQAGRTRNVVDGGHDDWKGKYMTLVLVFDFTPRGFGCIYGPFLRNCYLPRATI